MGDRRVQAARRDAVRGRRITLGVTGPMNVATTDAASREDGREDQRMVTAAAAFEGGLAAELGRDHDERGFKEALGLEILDEGCEHAVEIAADILHAIIQGGVHVPATMGDFDEAHAVLDETSGEQAALPELALAIARPRGGRLGGQIEGLEVSALHELEGGLVEFVVSLDVLVRGLAAEAGVKLRQQGGPLAHDGLADRALGVQQSVVGIEDRERRIGRREPAVTMVGRTIDGHGRRQGLMAGTEEVLRPGAERGVLHAAALLETGAHEVGRRGVHADLGGHGTDDGDLVADLGGLRQEGCQLHIALGGDDFAGPLARPGLGIEGVDVGHAPVELQEDHVLGLAEAREAGVRRFDRALLLGGRSQPREGRQDAQAEGDLGALLQEATAVLRVAEQVSGDGEVHRMKRNSRVLARTQARSVRARPPSSEALAAVSSVGVGRRARKER